ncbi:hypothetical protein Barb6_00906 [Bacteroidales bacterium Barb6]|nr:hypothetical protein Barb6_00906 [Bacteroidales bacterium Barb6]
MLGVYFFIVANILVLCLIAFLKAPSGQRWAGMDIDDE